MNRRGFLSLIAPAAALIVAPELLIPKRTFFLPPVGGWGGHMTATEVLSNYRRYWDDAVYRATNPPLMVDNLMADLVAYGMNVTEIQPGNIIRRIPPNEWPSGQRITERAGLPSKLFRAL